MGTWKFAMIDLEKPESVFLIKNSGDFVLGKGKDDIIVCSEQSYFEHDNKLVQGLGLEVQKVPNNSLLEIKDNLEFNLTKLEKKITVERKPKFGYDHIFEEEIHESADAVNHAIDFGNKFITNH